MLTKINKKKKSLPQILKKLRIEHGYTYKVLSKKINLPKITQDAIRHYEGSFRKNFDPQVLKKLEQIYSLPNGYLVNKPKEDHDRKVNQTINKINQAKKGLVYCYKIKRQTRKTHNKTYQSPMAYLKCPQCHTKWQAFIDVIMRPGVGCPKCNRQKAHEKERIPAEIYKKDVLKAIDKKNRQKHKHIKFKKLMPRINNERPRVELHCKKCGYVFHPTVVAVKRGSFGCVKCKQDCIKGKHRTTFTQEAYRDRLVKYSNERVIAFKGDILNGESDVLVECQICKHVWWQKPRSFNIGHRCPVCREPSRGEAYVFWVFKESGIIFNYHQKIQIPDKNGKLHPHEFDFGIPVNSKIIFVEIDGSQHHNRGSSLYEPIRPIRDADKNHFVNQNPNKYGLIRIDFNNQINIFKALGSIYVQLVKKLQPLLSEHHLIRVDTHKLPKIHDRKKISDYYQAHDLHSSADFWNVSRTFVEESYRMFHQGKNKKENSIPQRKHLEKEISSFYLNHSIEQVENKYHHKSAYIDYIFRRYHNGLSKTDYLYHDKNFQNEVLDHYLHHYLGQTKTHYSLSGGIILKWFKKKYGVYKRLYLAQHHLANVDFKRQVVEYAKNNSIIDTIHHFNSKIGRNTIWRYFKEITGKNKVQYLKSKKYKFKN